MPSPLLYSDVTSAAEIALSHTHNSSIFQSHHEDVVQPITISSAVTLNPAEPHVAISVQSTYIFITLPV